MSKLILVESDEVVPVSKWLVAPPGTHLQRIGSIDASGKERMMVRAECGVMLTVPTVPDRARAVRAARSWFQLCVDGLLGSFGEFLRTASPLPDSIQTVVDVTIDPPRGTRGTPWEWRMPYSPQTWAEFLARLEALPSYAAFAAMWDGHFEYEGIDQPEPTVTMASRESTAELFSTVAVGLLDDPAGQRRVLATVREVAEIAAPLAASVAVTATFLTTPLERAIDRYGSGLAEAGTFLRNYGWLTVLNDEMTERVGGSGRLRASGAFVEVEPLAAGGWWLLATETWDEYGPEQANHLFELLAPVLPPGKAKLSEFRPVTIGGPPVLITLPNVVAERDPREITSRYRLDDISPKTHAGFPKDGLVPDSRQIRAPDQAANPVVRTRCAAAS